MKADFKDWLFASLYYRQYEWGVLLKKGILPFIKIMKEGSKVKSYVLHLSNYRGSYIGLSLQKNNGVQLDEVGSDVDRVFKNFFKLNPSSNYVKELISDKIFGDFPNNSIQYNLYNFRFSKSITLTRQKKIWLLNRMSEIMIKALGNEKTDDEMIFTYGCYLHLILLQILAKSLSEAANLLGYKILANTSTTVELKTDGTSHITKKNSLVSIEEDIIIDIIKDIWFRKAYQYDENLQWIKQVMKIYSSAMIRPNRTRPQGKEVSLQDSVEIYTWLGDIIKTQLGMNDDAQYFLLHYIRNGMETILKEQSKIVSHVPHI